jgi:carboxyl-terminal processing protease
LNGVVQELGMSRANLTWIICVPMVLLTGLALSHAARPKDRDYPVIDVFVDVLSQIDKYYVRELDEKAKVKLVEDMINGGLEKLDPYSSYFNSDEYRAFESQTEGNFGGVGIQLGVDPKSGILMVISPMVGTPAYEAGILAGDLIVKIDGKSTESLRINDAVKIIQGEPGTPVTLTVLHEGTKETKEYSVKRARIEIQTVMGYRRSAENAKEWDWFYDKANGVGYIRLTQFNEKSTADLTKAVLKLQADGARGLILDLRDNPGGLLTAAVEISDMFMTHGKIVSTRDRAQRERSFEATVQGTLMEPANAFPMAVLVNKNSASASEIVSAALQDHHRAVVIGERSFGKGSVQKIIRMPNVYPPTALKLTTDTYWRPSGQNIHRYPDSKETDEWGVKPNPGYEIEMKDEERLKYLLDRRDRDVIRNGTKKEEPAVKEKDKDGKEKEPFTDRALQKAVDYIKTKAAGTSQVKPLDLQLGVAS